MGSSKQDHFAVVSRQVEELRTSIRNSTVNTPWILSQRHIAKQLKWTNVVIKWPGLSSKDARQLAISSRFENPGRMSSTISSHLLTADEHQFRLKTLDLVKVCLINI